MVTKPGPPLDPEFTNIGTSSLTVSWAPPDSDGGASAAGITLQYLLQRYKGVWTAGSPLQKQDTVTVTTVNVTNLAAGQLYTYFLWAYNGILSDEATGGALTVTTLAACWIRHNGLWVSGTPYVRSGGTWKQAHPFIRQANIWQPTE